MKEAVELLVNKAETLKASAESAYKIVMEVADKKLAAARAEASSLIRAAQEVCAHDGPIRQEQDDDYHKREYWTNHYCTLCGKLVKRV